jgi:glycosyltransferase involved in cell wall biosynthesis
MKILIATAHRSIVGGIETYLQTLIPALLQRGHQVATLTEHPSDPALAAIDPPEAELPAWYCGDLRRNPDLWRELERWRPDVVYSHGVTSLDIDRELEGKYPTITYLHGYWGTCATGRKCHAFPNIQPCTRSFGPACLLLHFPRRCGGLNPLQAVRGYQSERARNARLPEYATVLVASTHMYAEFQRNGVSADRLRLLRLPVTGVSRSIAPRPKTPSGKLLFMGRLTDLKGADFLIRAIPAAEKKLGSKLALTIAGDGRELASLEHLSRKLDIAVTFAGWVSGDEKLELMLGADLLVAPSLWPEPFGLIGVEAGCVGLPAAGFAAGGIPDWLIPGRTGELAPADPPTVEGLADAMVRALADPAHYYDLCRGAFELSQLFTLDRHVAELETILSAHAGRSGACEGALPFACNHGHQ